MTPNSHSSEITNAKEARKEHSRVSEQAQTSGFQSARACNIVSVVLGKSVKVDPDSLAKPQWSSWKGFGR